MKKEGFDKQSLCSEIDAWRDKKVSEEANARYNEMLYYGLGTEEE